MTSKINGIGYSDRFRRIEHETNPRKVSEKRSESSEITKNEGVKESVDRVVISTAGKLLNQKSVEAARYLDEVRRVTNVDEETLKEIKQRIDVGYYSEPAVVSKIVADLATPPPYPAGKPVAAATTGNVQEPPSQKDGQITELRQKVQAGLYESDRVIDQIADKLLEPGNI